MEINTLLESLDSVIAIPVIPFNKGTIDYNGHQKKRGLFNEKQLFERW